MMVMIIMIRMIEQLRCYRHGKKVDVSLAKRNEKQLKMFKYRDNSASF